MEQVALIHWQQTKIQFKILKVEGDKVVIGVTQAKISDGQYLSKKELEAKAHAAFDQHLPGKKVVVHSSPHEESPALKVTPEWIKKKMEKHGVSLKEMSEETGLNNTQLSPLTTGSKPLSDAMKAMFYFYFRAKEIKDES